MTLYLNNAPTNINLYITPHVVTFRIYEFQINIYGFRLRGLGTAFAYLCQYNCHHLYEYRFIRPIYISFIHHDIASVGGVTVSMVAFQAVDPGSTPGRRTHFTANHLFIFIFLIWVVFLSQIHTWFHLNWPTTPIPYVSLFLILFAPQTFEHPMKW